MKKGKASAVVRVFQRSLIYTIYYAQLLNVKISKTWQITRRYIYNCLYWSPKRQQVSIWLAPEITFAKDKQATDDRAINTEGWNFVGLSEKPKERLCLYLMPDGLRFDYLKVALLWLNSFFILGIYFSNNFSHAFLKANPSNLPYNLTTISTIFVGYFCLAVTILSASYVLHRSFYRLSGYKGRSALFFLFAIYLVSHIWASYGVPIHLTNVASNIVASVGFVLIWVIAPVVIYGVLRRPPPVSLDKMIPEGFREEWGHAPHKVISSFRAVFYWQLFLHIIFCVFQNNNREPVYWHSTPNNKQKGLIGYLSQTFVKSIMEPIRPVDGAYVLVFFMGPVIIPYAGLWLVAFANIYSPMALGLLAIIWAVASSVKAMSIMHGIFSQKQQDLADWFPSAFIHISRSIKSSFDISDIKVREYTYLLTHSIFTVLLIAYLTYLAVVFV